MYDLKEKITFEYRATDGTNTGVCLGDYSNPRADIGGVVLSFSNNGNMSPYYFLAAKIPNYDPNADPLYIYSNGSFNGNTTVVNDPVNFSGFWITENDSSWTFMTYYEMVFGAGKTRQEIFAELQELYGDDYTFFGIVTYYDNFPIPDYYRTQGYYFKDDPEHTKISTIATNSVTGYVIDSNYIDCFDSLQAIDPEILENILAMPYDIGLGAAFYFMMSPAPEPEEKLIFDVYVDGEIGGKGPTVNIKWRNANPDTTNLAPALIRPHVWGAGYPGIGEPSGVPISFIHYVDGVQVPDNDKTPFNTMFEFADEGYAADYVGASNVWYNNVSDAERVLNFGIDMIPIDLVFLLRFDYMVDLGQWGDLWYVYIPYNYEGAAYVEHAQIGDSGYIAQFTTEVNIIGGLPPETTPDDPDEPEGGIDNNGDPSPIGTYDPDEDPIDFSESTPEGFGGNSVLTATYCMPTLTMLNVGGKLWSQSYFDVLKVQANPIENIISCKWFPFTVSGTEEEIQVGNVPFGVRAQRISNIKVIPFTSSYHYTETKDRKGYLSCSPFTMLKLHLPYCGVVQLDATELFDRTLDGKYVIDLTTGDVLVILTVDGMPYLNVSGKMGVDIPLSATNRAQTELAIANKSLSATLGAAAQTMGGNYVGAAGALGNGILSVMGMDYTTQRSGTQSSSCATYEDRAVWLEIIRSIAYVSEGYRSGHGYPAHLYRTLQKGQGYVQIDKGARISVAMTDEENRELETIMQQGFYV